MKKIEYVKNIMKTSSMTEDVITLSAINKAYEFHKSMPSYEPTPCWELDNLAQYLGVKKIYIKDESYRFGLNAFKVLGASFAIANEIIDEEVTFHNVIEEVKRKKIDFYSATDGNHGRAVAYTAKILSQKAYIYMPKGTTQNRLNNIKKENAYGEILDLNYDDCVRYAYQKSQENNGILVQDTAFDGYTKIPMHIMEGYTTILMEIKEQIKEPPTHVFLQAGVGSFASAMIAAFHVLFPNQMPCFVIVEPHQANCYYKSAIIHDNKPHAVKGDMLTLMSGLACGECNPISFEIIKSYADVFLSCDDSISAYGTRVLSSPLGNDQRIISGESGSVGLGALMSICDNHEYLELKNILNINQDSRILCISTEGNTDPDCYRDIVWNLKENFGG